MGISSKLSGETPVFLQDNYTSVPSRSQHLFSLFSPTERLRCLLFLRTAVDRGDPGIKEGNDNGDSEVNTAINYELRCYHVDQIDEDYILRLMEATRSYAQRSARYLISMKKNRLWIMYRRSVHIWKKN